MAARYDFAGYRDVLEAAGGSGGVSIGLAESCPGLHMTIADLPGVTPVTRRLVEEAGLRNRITIVTCDLLHETVPGTFDAAVASLFIQVRCRDEAQAALRNIAGALRPGGMVDLSIFVLDESRVRPERAARVNIIALSFYDHGRAYTEGEYRTWLTEAGLTNIVLDEDLNGLPLIRAHKPA